MVPYCQLHKVWCCNTWEWCLVQLHDLRTVTGFPWHHLLDGHEFEKAPGVGDGQESLTCCSLWGCKELDTTVQLNRMMGFPDRSVGKESTCNAEDPGLISGSGRSTGEEIGFPFQYFWASLVVQLVKKLPAVQETCVRSLGWDNPLEKDMAIHFWIIPWTEEPGGLQPMRSQKVRHNWVTTLSLSLFFFHATTMSNQGGNCDWWNIQMVISQNRTPAYYSLFLSKYWVPSQKAAWLCWDYFDIQYSIVLFLPCACPGVRSWTSCSGAEALGRTAQGSICGNFRAMERGDHRVLWQTHRDWQRFFKVFPTLCYKCLPVPSRALLILPNMIASGMGKTWMVEVAWKKAQMAGGLKLWNTSGWELTIRNQYSFVQNWDPQKDVHSCWRIAPGCLPQAGWVPSWFFVQRKEASWQVGNAGVTDRWLFSKKVLDKT